jgi:hypothetical protein
MMNLDLDKITTSKQDTIEQVDIRETTMKDRRRRPEGGKWEPIKIPQGNLAYIPKLTRRVSLLT